MKPCLQNEAAECGLACLVMVASAHGLHLDLRSLRRRFAVSLKGATLSQLVRFAGELGFSSRPLRLELEELGQLACPCILHWDLNHFVVLKSVRGDVVTLLDPAVGERRVALAQASRHFTGVALELAPNARFKAEDKRERVALRSLTGQVTGLRRSLLQVFALAAVLELFAIASPMLNQFVVDDAIGSHDASLLTTVVIGFGLLLLVQIAVGLCRSWMVLTLGQSLGLQWAANVFAHLLRLPMEFFEKRHLGDILSRLGATGAIQATLTTSVVEAVLDGFMVTASLAMMLVYSARLTCVVGGAVLSYGFLRWLWYRPLREASTERLVVSAHESTALIETVRAVLPLKLFGREDERLARWKNLRVDVQNRDIRTSRLTIAFGTLNTLIFGLENLLVFWIGGRTVMASGAGSTFTIGMLFAFVSYQGQFTGRIVALIDYAVEIAMLTLHAERLADIVLTPPEPDTSAPSDLAHLRCEIALRHVSFRYGEGEPWILKDVNLSVRAGESVALVGASGGGKTTLLKIVLGLLAPTEGEVLYGGLPLKQVGVRNYRRLIGTVMQDDVLLAGSIADNISFFDVDADDRRVQACARLAAVDADILRMPMGYQTLVGDMGSSLSGGQKQRVLLARALYKQPRILALDEATSHLDIANERRVSQMCARLRLMRIMVAHRPETIADAQRVIRLSGGRVTEIDRRAPGEIGAETPPLSALHGRQAVTGIITR